MAGIWLILLFWNAGTMQSTEAMRDFSVDVGSTVSSREFHQAGGRSASHSGIPAPTRSSAKNPQTKKVLLINSYHQGYSFEDEILDGLNARFAQSPFPIEMEIEYLDTKHYEFTEQYKLLLKQIFDFRHKGRVYDAIIAANDNALDFVRENHRSLFNSVPVIFTGINRINIGNQLDRKQFTGVMEHEEALATLQMALKLHPGTKRVELVYDNTVNSNNRWQRLHAQLHKIKGVTFERIGHKRSLPQLLEYLSRLDNNTIVGFGSLFRDGIGTELSLKQGAEFVARASPRPVYGFHRPFIPFGMVGGRVVGGYLQGEDAALSAIQLLSGKRPEDIPLISEETAEPVFNYEGLRRFGISEQLLPPGSQILNKPYSLWNLNRKFAIGSIALISILGAAVLWNIRINRALKANRAKLKEALDTAELANRAKNVFLANVSHELRTPLNAIIGFSELIRIVNVENERERRDKVFEYSNAISLSGVHLLAIVNSLIGITNIESGRYEVTLRKTSFRKIIEETANVLEGEQICRRAIVKASCLDETFIADSSLLSQALANLLLNAYEHNPRGTRISLSIEKDIDQTTIQVEDDGVGISSEQLQNSQSSRWDLDSENDAYVSDTNCIGLGIRFSRMLVEKHGGSLIISSEPGAGTRVAIILPNTIGEQVARNNKNLSGKARRNTPNEVTNAEMTDKASEVSCEVIKATPVCDERMVG